MAYLILLMIPGPSEPEPEVLSALALPILPHYGAKWRKVYDDTTSNLQKIFKTKNEVIIVPVPGQVAVEMAVANLVPKGKTAFVCVNGYFSEMIADIVRYWGGKLVVIRSKPGSPVSAEKVEAALGRDRGAVNSALFFVQNETSTGVQSQVNEVFKVCDEHGVLKVLDSISAFGGIDIRVDQWKADFAIGYASKALGGVFGALPLALSETTWEVARKNSDRIHTRFLNLNVWRKAIEEMGPMGHPHLSTMPTSVVVGMKRATELVLQEGLEARYRRHKEVARFARTRLQEMGLELFPELKFASNTVSVAKVDPRWDAKLRSELFSRYNIMIAGGLSEQKGKIIRIGHMGTSATLPSVALTMTAIESILPEVRS
jgi:alanine-glyoxylate transaminase / serine-glyoxylate transaminase / serine-pyruvate transaminase